MRPNRLLTLICLAGLATTGAAFAQPYQPGPPPPPMGPGGPPPGFPPGEGFHHRGFNCEAFFPTPNGPRRRFCPIEGPQPIGSFCTCEGPPGFPPARGHVVR